MMGATTITAVGPSNMQYWALNKCARRVSRTTRIQLTGVEALQCSSPFHAQTHIGLHTTTRHQYVACVTSVG